MKNRSKKGHPGTTTTGAEPTLSAGFSDRTEGLPAHHLQPTLNTASTGPMAPCLKRHLERAGGIVVWTKNYYLHELEPRTYPHSFRNPRVMLPQFMMDEATICRVFQDRGLTREKLAKMVATNGSFPYGPKGCHSPGGIQVENLHSSDPEKPVLYDAIAVGIVLMDEAQDSKTPDSSK